MKKTPFIRTKKKYSNPEWDIQFLWIESDTFQNEDDYQKALFLALFAAHYDLFLEIAYLSYIALKVDCDSNFNKVKVIIRII